MDELLYLNQSDIEKMQLSNNNNNSENFLTLEMLTLKEHEDWVIVKEKELKEEDLENGFIKYDLQDDV